MCKPVQELVILDIHQQCEVVQEVGADDGLLDVGYDECPVEGAPEAKVERERPCAKRCDGCVVTASRWWLCWCLRSVCEGGLYAGDEAMGYVEGGWLHNVADGRDVV